MNVDTFKILEGNKEYSVAKTPFYEAWFFNNKRHREEGPAWVDLYTLPPELPIDVWYLHGQPINCTTQEDFKRILKLKAFL